MKWSDLFYYQDKTNWPFVPRCIRSVPFDSVRVLLLTNYSPAYFYPYFCRDYGDIMSTEMFRRRCEQNGLLFWNTLWEEWVPGFNKATEEVIECLDSKRTVFFLSDKNARKYESLIHTRYCQVIYTKERLFSTINDCLCNIPEQPIDWRKDREVIYG